MSKTESFNRPNHTDFMDALELKKIEFSGTRVNSISHDFEVWMKGVIVNRVTSEQLRYNPLAINEAMEETFALDKVMPDTPEAKRYMAIMERMQAYNETVEQLGGIPNETDYALNGSASPLASTESTDGNRDDEEIIEQRTDWTEFLGTDSDEEEEPVIDEIYEDEAPVPGYDDTETSYDPNDPIEDRLQH
jgi:hypothetical protein